MVDGYTLVWVYGYMVRGQLLRGLHRIDSTYLLQFFFHPRNYV